MEILGNDAMNNNVHVWAHLKNASHRGETSVSKCKLCTRLEEMWGEFEQMKHR